MASENDALKSISLVSIRRYLQLNGWRETATNSDATTLFAWPLNSEDQVEIPLPIRHGIAGTDRMIFEAVRTLTQISGGESRQLVDDINSVGFDRIRSIIPDELVRSDSIDLSIAGGFFYNARRLIMTAATVELEPSAFFGRVSKEALAYTDGCRFGHTFRGSFGFTIESPVKQNNEPSLEVVEEVAPFARRVVQRLAKGLELIRQAENANDPEIIARSFEMGFNANMCDVLLDLLRETSDRLRFEIAWSPEWKPPADLQHATYLIKPSTVDIVREAANSLRRVDEARMRNVQGKVTKLKSEHNPADLLDLSSPREIVIQWVTEEHGHLNVKVFLSPEDYIIAVEAHRSGRSVSVSGLLERIGRTWVLSGPSPLNLQ